MEPGAPPCSEEIEEESVPLRKLGWIEGRNLRVDRRYANGRAELLRPLSEELVRLKVELIVASGTGATLAVKSATNTIPIVFSSAGDPVRAGLVASLSRPGGNVTGYSIVSPELYAKRLAMLRELFPALQRVGYLQISSDPYSRVMREELERACRSLGIRPIFVEIVAADEIPKAVAEVVREGGQALLVPPNNMLYENRAELMRGVLNHSLPTIVPSGSAGELGALISYDSTLSEQYIRNAAYIDRILRGAKPAELPVEQPTQFKLIINLRTAKALGIKVPQPLLSRADEIIR